MNIYTSKEVLLVECIFIIYFCSITRIYLFQTILFINLQPPEEAPKPVTEFPPPPLQPSPQINIPEPELKELEKTAIADIPTPLEDSLPEIRDEIHEEGF